MVNEHVGITLDVLPGTMAGITAALGGFNELVAATSMFASAVGKSTSVVDSMILTLGVGLAGAAWESAKAFGEVERSMKIVQAVSGQTSGEIAVLTQKANEFSVKYKMGIDDMTAGLQTLGRAGLSSVNTQIDTLQAGLQAAKTQGIALDDALNKIVQTTSLLGGDINTSNFGQQAQDLTSKILATAMSAPIDMNDVVQTLSYSGGTAAAAGINIQNPDALYDYLGTISAFAQKGVTGSMAGTAMRAFFTKPASQDTSVVEALGRLDMKASDLWEAGGNKMRPVSEQIGLIHQQMDKLHMSTLDQIELWGKIVGPKMGQQMMKLDDEAIKKNARSIRETASAEELAATTMKNFMSELEALTQRGQKTWRDYGNTAIAWIGPVISGLNLLYDTIGGLKTPTLGIPIVQQIVKMGIIVLISQIIQRLGNVWNLFKNIGTEIKSILATGSQSRRTAEQLAAEERRRLQGLGLTEKQANSLVQKEKGVASGLSISNQVLAEFLVKLNEAVSLMAQLASLSRVQSMTAISSISTAQHNRAFMEDGTKGMSKTAWFKGMKGGDLTRNEFATLALRHGMNIQGKGGLLDIYKSSEFQSFWKNNQSKKAQFPTAISLEKYLQENQKGMYDPKINPIMGVVSQIKTDTGNIATQTRTSQKASTKTSIIPTKTESTSQNSSSQRRENQKNKKEVEIEKQTVEEQKQTEEKKQQNIEEEKKTNSIKKQNQVINNTLNLEELAQQRIREHLQHHQNLIQNRKKEGLVLGQLVYKEEEISREIESERQAASRTNLERQKVNAILSAKQNELKSPIGLNEQLTAEQRKILLRSPYASMALAIEEENIALQTQKKIALQNEINILRRRASILGQESNEHYQNIEQLKYNRTLTATKLDVEKSLVGAKEEEYLTQEKIDMLESQYINYLQMQINKVSGNKPGFNGRFTTRNANRRVGQTAETDNLIVKENRAYTQELRQQLNQVTNPATKGSGQVLKSAIQKHINITEMSLKYVEEELRLLSEDAQYERRKIAEKGKIVAELQEQKALLENQIPTLQYSHSLLVAEQEALRKRVASAQISSDMYLLLGTKGPLSKRQNYMVEYQKANLEFAELKNEYTKQKNEVKESSRLIKRTVSQYNQISADLTKEEQALQEFVIAEKNNIAVTHKLEHAILKNSELRNELNMLYSLEKQLQTETLSQHEHEILQMNNQIQKDNELINSKQIKLDKYKLEASKQNEILEALEGVRNSLFSIGGSTKQLNQINKEIENITKKSQNTRTQIWNIEETMRGIIARRMAVERELLAKTSQQNIVQPLLQQTPLRGFYGLNGEQNHFIRQMLSSNSALRGLQLMSSNTLLALPPGPSKTDSAKITQLSSSILSTTNQVRENTSGLTKITGAWWNPNIKNTATIAPNIDPRTIYNPNFSLRGASYNPDISGMAQHTSGILQLEKTAKTFQTGFRYNFSSALNNASNKLSSAVNTASNALTRFASRVGTAYANTYIGQKTSGAIGFGGAVKSSYLASLQGRQNFDKTAGFWKNWAMNSGMSAMVDWRSIQKSTDGLGKLKKAAGVAGGALGSFGMMFGPAEVAMMGLSMAMQAVQQAQQKYQEELEKINSNLAEARENLEKAEDSFMEAYEEQNPKATQEQKDQAYLNLYLNGEEDRNDGLDSYRANVRGALNKIEINTREKAKKENDFWFGAQGGAQKGFWSHWDELWGTIFDNSNITAKNELGEQFDIAKEGAQATGEYNPSKVNSAQQLETTYQSILGTSDSISYRLDYTLSHYENWIDDLEDYSSQAKYATALINTGMDSTGASGGSDFYRAYGDYGAKTALSQNGINDYRAFEKSLAKIPASVQTQITNSINEDPDFYKRMQRQMFSFKDNKLQRTEGNEVKILQAIGKRVGNITTEQAKQTLILSTISSIHDFVQNQIQPTLMANVESSMQGVNTLGLTNMSVGYTGSTTSAVHQGVMNIIAQLGTLIEQKTLENMSLLSESAGINFKDLNDLARAYDKKDSTALPSGYNMSDAGQARKIMDTMMGMYAGTMVTKGMPQEDAYKYAQTKFDELYNTKTINGKEFTPEITDMMRTWEKWFTPTMTPYVEEQWAKSLTDETGTATGPESTGKDKSKDKDKDSSSNRKNWVNLAICNKKEIPKLNVNLFKKPPNFTILNRNFKLRDVNVNTADDAKSIQNAVKNSIIEIQNRSNPKIIQDDAAEYDPLAATEGNTLPVGTKKTE